MEQPFVQWSLSVSENILCRKRLKVGPVQTIGCTDTVVEKRGAGGGRRVNQVIKVGHVMQILLN